MKMSSFLHRPEQIMTLSSPSSFSILILLLFIPIFIKWFFYNNSKTRKNLPPSPPKLPVIGNIHQLGVYPHRSLQKLSQRYGPIMYLLLGSSPTFVISSPEGAREIMQTHDLIFANRPDFEIFRKLLYNSRNITASPYGEYWRQIKSICTLQLLSKKRVLSFRAVREEETALAMEIIKEESCDFSKAVNLSDMFTLISKNVVCRAAFGRKYEDGENGRKFKQLWTDFFDLIGTANVEDFLPWLAWINHINGKNAKTDRVAKELDDFLEGVVEEHMARFETRNTFEKSYENVSTESGEDFVDILIRIYKEQKAPETLGRDSVKAIILDMFGAGLDTTSTLTDWAMTELLRHPSIMKKLQDEVRGIANGKLNVNEDDLEKMAYLKAVLKETLRYHPPVPTIVPRRPTQDVKVMGYNIPAGSMVIINAYAIARDPLLWDDPEEFKPERFLNSPRDYKGLDFEFLPFGAGRRGCPGISFAIATNELALANIVHKFDWKLPNGAKGEDLDMTERSGITTHRKDALLAIPSPFPSQNFD